MEEGVAVGNSCLPTTRDVLGAHLHQKVTAALSVHVIDGQKIVSDGCILADKITGMLLERSLKDIHTMLQDETFLLKNLNMALDVLLKECPYLIQTPSTDRLKDRQELSLDQIGEMLFERVYSIEESLAPQITGMILELDLCTLLHLINNDGLLLESAVKKAKDVLSSVTSVAECHPGLHPLSPPPELTSADVNCQSQGELEHEAGKDDLGDQLYEQVMEAHPECASDVTGMILELEPQVLAQILRDKQQLEVAITKAYTEWMKHS